MTNHAYELKELSIKIICETKNEEINSNLAEFIDFLTFYIDLTRYIGHKSDKMDKINEKLGEVQE